MTVPILVEPTETGYRAATGAPFHLSADAPTAEDAVAAVRRQLDARVAAGAVMVPYPIPPQPFVLPLAENPLFDDWLKAIEENRAEADAAEAARGD